LVPAGALDGRIRVVIENVRPEVEGGAFPIKRVVGEKVVVRATVFADGHDEVRASVLYRKEEQEGWREAPMRPLLNDGWEGEFPIEETGVYLYTVQGWVDHIETWFKDLQKKSAAGQDLSVDLLIGSAHLEKAAERAPGADRERMIAWANALREDRDTARAVALALSEEVRSVAGEYPDKSLANVYDELRVTAERPRALFSAWYEIFPRACDPGSGRHSSFRDCERLLPEIADMGFDVLYFPPIHPIGRTNRKGRNNVPEAREGDPGSPWAIGSAEGGHKAVHPALGTVEDFQRLLAKAGERGLEVAMDLAFQCSPDHPYVKEHPEWFRWRPDGTVQFAENPPKKYQDIIPLDFETENWRELWEELRSVVYFWLQKGVRIFRVDNPHTKPFAFWQWLIGAVKKDYADAIFLSEAFTRPNVMYRLARIGFTQSYTYFTWRNTKWELTGYMQDLVDSDVRDYFRPNFWTNTPDILPEYLQYGGRAAFVVRLILAATLSPSYGVYGPAFELCASEALEGREEYLDSEKYEIRKWDVNRPGHLRDTIARVNRIRRENPALQSPWNVSFHEADNDDIIFYVKRTEDLSNTVFVVVNLNPYHKQSCRVRVPMKELGIPPEQPYLVHDLLSGDKYIWQGEWNYIELDPKAMPAHIFQVRSRLRREKDFDYFM
jgi:starch synthase (maltosyl-transferring)